MRKDAKLRTNATRTRRGRPANSRSAAQGSARRRTQAKHGNVVVIAARSRAATHGKASQHRRPRPVRHQSGNNQHAESSMVLGLVINAAVLIEETVVHFAARLTLSVIGGFEAVLRRVLRFEERAAETMAEAVEAVPREAAHVVDKVGAVTAQLAAA